MKKVIILISVIFLGTLYLISHSQGKLPNEAQRKQYKKSKNYNYEKHKFLNRRPGLFEAMMKRSSAFANFSDIFLNPPEQSRPLAPLPEIKPQLTEFLNSNDRLKVIWFGHSTFLLNISGKIVLVDPIFSQSASPLSFLVKRFQDPVLSLEELPNIDYILISHDHYDHLDKKSIQFFKDKENLFITPLGVGARIESWGIDRKRIIERDWWQETQFDEVNFIATPSQHFSGRGLFDRDCTQWASWVIRSDRHRVFFSGDSGYDVHFKEIGERLGPFDVAFLESGQYNERWREVHMLPEDAAKAYVDLRAKKYFPVHWGMFVLSKHSWFEPVEKLYSLSGQYKINLVVPQIGQTVDFSEEYKSDFWWRSINEKLLKPEPQNDKEKIRETLQELDEPQKAIDKKYSDWDELKKKQNHN